jgi:site-specific DNA-cytosine methylase
VLRALDLFSGPGSVAEALRSRGYDVVTVDNDKSRGAAVQQSILEWDYMSKYPVGYFDVIAASPPCTEYSTAMTRWWPRLLRSSDI